MNSITVFRVFRAAPCLFLLAGALTSLICAAQAQHAVGSTAVVSNGVVISINLTDGGAGYRVPPKVVLGGGGGTRAVASALIANGAVTAIQVINGGQGFTNAPRVGIEPPDASPSTLSILSGSKVSVIGNLGSRVELQASAKLGAGSSWSSVTNVQLTQCPWVLSDLVSPGVKERYYRAIEQSVERPVAPGDFVWLPAGVFTMGTAANDTAYLTCEGPQTQVHLTQGFFLCQHEVTQDEYAMVIGSTPSYFEGGVGLPVESVSWEEAVAYCAKLTTQEREAGRLSTAWRYRLPTEAEWEYACRAGTTTSMEYGENLDYSQLGHYAWYANTAAQMPEGVGQLRPNGWGLFDMAGNVAEWCWDVFGDYAGGRPVDPVGTQAGQYRVARGGSWNDPGERCRSGARASYLATGTPFKSAQIGFRVALAPVYEQSQPVAQSGLLEGTITGRITMQTDGMPAPGVQVTLVNTSVTADTNNYQLNRRAFVQVAMSDSDGRYTFSNVKPGDYGVSPFRSDTNSTYYFQQDPATEPAQLKVNKDVHQVNFIVDDPSLHEGVGEVVFNVRVINSPPDAGFSIYVSRRYWALFIPMLMVVGVFDWDVNVLPRSSWVYSFKTDYGLTTIFGSMENFYSLDFNVWGVGPNRNLGSKVIYFPLNACPAVANFVYDYNTGAFYQVP